MFSVKYISLLELISHLSYLSKLMKQASWPKTLLLPFCSLCSCVHMSIMILCTCNPLPDGAVHQTEKHWSVALLAIMTGL